MQQKRAGLPRNGTGRMGPTRSGMPTAPRVTALAASLAALVGLSACTAESSGSSPAGSGEVGATTGRSGSGSPAPGSTVPGEAVSQASVSATAVGGLRAANPAKPVSIEAAHGTLRSVRLVNASGYAVKGTASADGATWTTAEPLGYSKTYTWQATARDPAGLTTTARGKLTTLTPNNMTLPYFDTINGTSMTDGATYGVGMVIGVHFDEPIPNRTKAEKALQVSTSPHVQGAWYWLDDQNVHWRPRHYYATGTTVKVKANVYGVDFGGGLYGQSDEQTSFTIGQRRVSVANAKTHRVRVYVGGKQVRNMPTSMGRGGYVHGENGPIALWTPPGTYTVITKENPAIMSSDSYGLPTNSPDGYGRLVVPWSTKISTDGIYLHELDSTVSEQGRENVSHGCLNLNHKNAKWFFRHSRVGDVVRVVHSGGPTLQVWRGGDWSVPWSQWVKGGAA